MAFFTIAFALLAAATPVKRHDLPGTWVSNGCWTDSVTDRTLIDATFTDLASMTDISCIDFCDAKGFVFAATEFASECYCGNFLKPTSTLVDEAECNVPCAGDASEICGGELLLSLFWNGVTPPTPPSTIPAVGDWVSLGCFSDNVEGRALTTGPVDTSDAVSIEKCTDACFNLGLPLAGTEFGQECWCGAEVENGGALATITDCNIACVGNSSEFCGGPNRLNLYNFTGTDLPVIGGGGGEGGGTGGGPTPNGPVLTGLPEPWAYSACYVDGAFGRVFTVEMPATANNTVETCIAACDARGFNLTGVEFINECWCGNEMINGAVVADESSCNLGCAGDATEACGGANRISVYSTNPDVTIIPVPTAQTTDLPEGWAYAGCFTDLFGNTQRALAHQIILPATNSAPACIEACLAFNPAFTAIGAEFGQECYCGATEDLAAHNSTQSAETDCNVACSGDEAHLCGGGFRISTYEFTAAPA
ncbi:WSC domain-containing protein [Mycena floridula]|nr:WSC domain-containing protein [Mycena floridula]